MAKLLLNGKEIEMIPDDDWTTTETTNAESALGIDYFGGTGMEQLKVCAFVSAMREDPTMEPVALADAIGQMKLGALNKLAQEVADEDPLESPDGDDADRQIFGAQLLDNLASPSPFQT